MPEVGFTLDIVTPERLVARIGDAVSLVVPAEGGYLGILSGHAPLIARMVPGEITLKRATGQEQLMATSGGFVEVTSERVTILADTAENPDEIDVDRAKAAYSRALERIQGHREGVDVDRARIALERAIARLKTAGQKPL